MRKRVIISVLMIALAGCQTAGGGVSQAPGEPGRKENNWHAERCGCGGRLSQSDGRGV